MTRAATLADDRLDGAAAIAAYLRLSTAAGPIRGSEAYGEHAPIPLLADIPDWLAEAAYDEQDRRMFGGQLCVS